MKPEQQSKRLLSITQSKAKMYEYDVPIEHHIVITRDPAHLFSLTIGMLGDIAAEINKGISAPEIILEFKENLPFSARFFDTYVQTKLNNDIDPYLLAIGSAAYYLCEMPGSSHLLAKRLNGNNIDLEGFGLDSVLIWLLQGNFTQQIDLETSPFREILSPIIQQFQRFVADGSGAQELNEQARTLRTFIYQKGTPRQLFFVDLVGALINKRIANSTWTTLPSYSALPVDKWANVIRKDTFIKELWPAQHRLGEKGVFSGKSAIVQMPTSAGKTKAIEVVLRSAFLAERIQLAVIVAPFRALCHEIKDDFLKAFRGENIYVTELSDTLQIDYLPDRLLRNNQVVIVTPEKLNFVLRHSPEFAEHIGLLIYDEGHQFDNGTRGITYELLLTSLKTRVPPQAQTILISAVISNAKQIGQWLLGENFEIVSGNDLLPSYRSVAFASWPEIRYGRLEFVNPTEIDNSEFYVPRIIQQYNLGKRGGERKDRKFPEKTEVKDISLYFGLKLVGKGSVAIFCGQKATVTGVCSRAVEIFNRNVPLQSPQQVIGSKEEIRKLWRLYSANLGSDSPVTQSAELGIFAHNNNIPHGIRLSVEFAIKKGLASFVVCTSTLAQGVNLPIRYLFVASVQQGKDQISVRDFQNLIGRSGRSDQHTEGSIIFPDPLLYDKHEEKEGRWRWNETKKLLSPSNSEPCTSSLYSLFEKLKSDDKKFILDSDPFELIDEYNRDFQSLNTSLESFAKEHADKKFSVSGLLKQVAYKTHLITAVESYLMAHWDESQPELDEEAISALARGTLAYFLANEDQDEHKKEQILKLFLVLAHNIAERVPETHTRIIFGRTLFGLQDAVAISNWLNGNIDQLVSVQDSAAILNILWPLFREHIHSREFVKCDQPALLEKLAELWIAGNSFFDLYQILLKSGARIIAGTRRERYQIEDVVGICENGFAYDGMLLIGAVIEFLQEMTIEGKDELIELMLIFQKQMKYGLSAPIAIALYELGFSDRFVAMDLSTILNGVRPDREIVIQALRGRREQVFEKLSQYPEYFSEVYRVVAT
jgi:POLQ-like helicase